MRTEELNSSIFFFFNDTATTEIYTLSLHDALPISSPPPLARTSVPQSPVSVTTTGNWLRSEEHTSELQSPCNLVCRLLLEKKKTNAIDVALITHRSCAECSHPINLLIRSDLGSTTV